MRVCDSPVFRAMGWWKWSNCRSIRFSWPVNSTRNSVPRRATDIPCSRVSSRRRAPTQRYSCRRRRAHERTAIWPLAAGRWPESEWDSRVLFLPAANGQFAGWPVCYMQLAHFTVGPRDPFFLIAGPDVIESEALVMEVAGAMQEITSRLQ